MPSTPYNSQVTFQVNTDDIEKYFAIYEISGVTKNWLEKVNIWIEDYLNYINYNIDQLRTLEYIKSLKNTHSITYYRKKTYQIRKFLTYLDIDWASKLKPPPEPNYIPKYVKREDISDTLTYFKDNDYYLQLKSLILLGISSGLRAEELYQLNLDDIDMDNRIVHINHNPQNGQSTKTKHSRISFFDDDAREALSEYLTYFHSDRHLKQLFSQSHITRLFRDAPIQVKDLRKFFSQEWDRRGGPTSIKKILMGHSLKGDVDLMHYNAQSPEDLKKIYDRVMSDNGQGRGRQ
jgi:integrase/recombinase XerD